MQDIFSTISVEKRLHRETGAESALVRSAPMSPELADTAWIWLLRALYAAVLLGIGLWFAFYISGVARRQAIKHPRIDTTLGTFLALIVRYAIIVVVVIAVLQMFGVQTTSLVALMGAGALAIGLALQGTLGNVASGIMIAFMRPYHIGDFVEINGKEGKVIDLDLFFTTLRSTDERTVKVPNGQAMSNPIVNFTEVGRRRCIITVGIGYEDDIDLAMSVMKTIMTSDRRAMAEPPAWFGVDELAESSVNIAGRAWVATDDHRAYKADMLKAIKEAFDREGIEIPYPHAVEMSKGEIERRDPPIKPLPGAPSKTSRRKSA